MLEKDDLAEPRYLNDSDVQMRLDRTFIKYKGAPYYARARGSELSLSLIDIASGEIMVNKISANSKFLDIKSIELGYCNFDKTEAAYLTRVPFKKQKQGLSAENIGQIAPDGSLRLAQEGRLFCEGFKSCLLNSYPSFSSLMSPEKKFIKQGISKDFAILEKRELLMMEKKIGDITGGRVKLVLEYDNSFIVMNLASLGVPLV